MHKVGYPNLNVTGYSEDDSRDAAEAHRVESRRSTRPRRGVVTNAQYMYNSYDAAEVPPRTRRNEIAALHTSDVSKKISRRESNNKENNEEPALNGHDKRTVAETSAEEEEENSVKKKEVVLEEGVNDKTIVSNVQDKDEQKEEEERRNEESKRDTSESDTILSKIRTRTKARKNGMMSRSYTRRCPKQNPDPFGKYFFFKTQSSF